MRSESASLTTGLISAPFAAFFSGTLEALRSQMVFCEKAMTRGPELLIAKPQLLPLGMRVSTPPWTEWRLAMM